MGAGWVICGRASKAGDRRSPQAREDQGDIVPLKTPGAKRACFAAGTPQKTINDWVSEKSQLTIFAQPPGATTAQPWGSTTPRLFAPH
jgi:hypothetical protein